MMNTGETMFARACAPETQNAPAGGAFSSGLHGHSASGQHVDPVAFDDRVREQFLAHFLHALFSVGLGQTVLELELDDLADAGCFDLAIAHTGQRISDGLALRVQDAGLQGNVNDGLHYLLPPVKLTTLSVSPDSLMIPRRRATSA